MQITQLLADDEAVSPVVAVVLMVAVTVTLAAVVGGLALGMGADVDATPQAAFEYRQDGGNVTVAHVGGASLDPDRLTVKRNGAAVNATWSGAGDVSTGDRTTVAAASGDELRVVWRGDAGRTATLSTYEVP